MNGRPRGRLHEKPRRVVRRRAGRKEPLVNDTIKVSIESSRLTLTAAYPVDDLEGIRQSLALIQAFLHSLLGEQVPASRERTTRRGRKSADTATTGGAAQ